MHSEHDQTIGIISVGIGNGESILSMLNAFFLAFHRDGVDPTLAHPSLATQSGHGVLRCGHILNDTLTVNDQTDVRNHAQKLGKSSWIEVFGVHWYCKLSSVM